MDYQEWYTAALKLVAFLGRDRLDEFINYYRTNPDRVRFEQSTYTIQDYLSRIPYCEFDEMGNTITISRSVILPKFSNQIHILKSLTSRIDTILSDAEGHLFAELQDEELKVASQLAEINLRSAGAVAGVVLEKHLQRAATNHGIIIDKKEPTINDLNDPLKREGVYDIPTWRQIQVLGDIRNLCVHNKEHEPKEDQVKKLIEETDIIIKTIF